MLVWVNRKKAKREIKRAWNAFHEDTDCSLPAWDAVTAYINRGESFADSVARIARMLGIRDTTPPSEWDDC